MIRFALLQSILAAALAGLWIMGWLDEPFTGSAWPAVAALSGLTLIGILALPFRRGATEWIAEHITAAGLFGAVLGLIQAGSHVTDESSVREVLSGASLTWWSTAAGIAGMIWLRLTLALTKPAAASAGAADAAEQREAHERHSAPPVPYAE